MVLFYLHVLLYATLVLTQTTTLLQNNRILPGSIAAGSYNYYYFSIPAINQVFSKRAIPNIFLSITTCTQPTPPSTFKDAIPSFNVYISLSKGNTLPGPDNGISVNDAIHGLTTWTSNGASSEIWVAVGASSLPNAWTGNWTYEIGVSTNEILHPIIINADRNKDEPFMILDDTDRTNALFSSNPFQGTPPNSTVLITTNLPSELSHSLCAAKLYDLPTYSVNTSITTRGPLNLPRYQFMVSNLTQDTVYSAYLIQSVGSTIGLTAPIHFSTKIDANCRIIYDLPFCNQVAYSVPTDPDTFTTESIWGIANQYDEQALAKFEPFGTALSQFNCDTTQYSLVRNCTDCYRDYKTWLCSVSIPRCTDSSASGDLTQIDNVSTSPALRDISVGASRNPWVDDTMKPGEWTELLPCIDLCYHVVQSCPPFLQFFCPSGDLASMQYGYWQNGSALGNGTLYHFDINNPTCNRMGVSTRLLTISSASHIHSNSVAIFFIVTVVGLFFI
ncbi:stretch-activated Ca2+-permeable channel component-domain-containing protein [Helicostylum pulchrum]|nr:stretch-activated Ca2+-permeable channel component-domain-containing protein [Helicostylum pulchrum]